MLVETLTLNDFLLGTYAMIRTAFLSGFFFLFFFCSIVPHSDCLIAENLQQQQKKRTKSAESILVRTKISNKRNIHISEKNFLSHFPLYQQLELYTESLFFRF